MKLAHLGISVELLRQVLCFPEGVEIVNATIDQERHGVVLLTVAGDNLPVPEAKEGDRLPGIEVRITTHEFPCGHRTFSPEVAPYYPTRRRTAATIDA